MSVYLRSVNSSLWSNTKCYVSVDELVSKSVKIFEGKQSLLVYLDG